MSVKPVPDGYHSITPYLLVPNVAKLIDFLIRAFGATENLRHATPDGRVMHAEVQIGDSRVMMGEPPYGKATPASLYLYVVDVDATYARAIAAGGESVVAPHDEFYGDRVGGVKDPSGNTWWMATHKEDVSSEELSRRQAQRAAKPA